jgi:hypothetical protein
MRGTAILAGVLLLAPVHGHAQNERAAGGPLNTIKDIGDALRKCWVWPSPLDSSGNMDLTVMLSFRANGELFGGRITHMSRTVADNERELYAIALQSMIRRCSHLPMTGSLGAAVAGRPFIFRIIDNRKQRGA